MTDEIIEWAASSGTELEVTAFGLADQDALPLKRASDAFGHALNQLL